VVRKGRTEVLAVVMMAVMSLVSCDISLEPKEPTAPPKIPMPPRAQVEDGGIKISWDCVEGATKYSVFWGRERPRDYRGQRQTEGCSMILTGLAKGFIYRFAVTAWNKKGESDYSREIAIVFENDQRKADYYVLRGNHMWEKGRYQEAHIFFSTAIRLDPKNPKPYRRRAALSQQLNRAAPAQADLDMVEKLTNPTKQ
jgi:tetratricopeptide (TPR) repeat protein